MTTHDLKIWPEPFSALLDGTKRHEVRENDRGFAVGDVLHLREWQPPRWSAPGPADGPSHPGGYTGRTLDVRVTYLTPGGSWGLTADQCVMSVESVHAPTPAAPLDLEAAMWIVPGHAGDREWQVTGPDAEQRAKAVAAVTGTKPYPLYRIDAPALIARVRAAEADLAARDATIAELRAALFKAIAIAESLIDGLYTRPQAMKPPLARLRDAHLADAATRTDED